MSAKISLTAAALAILASGCASTPAPQVAASGAGTYYCWKDRLSADGDNLVCNWESSASAACRSSGIVTLRKSTIASGPDPGNLCPNGQWLVAVTTR